MHKAYIGQLSSSLLYSVEEAITNEPSFSFSNALTYTKDSNGKDLIFHIEALIGEVLKRRWDCQCSTTAQRVLYCRSYKVLQQLPDAIRVQLEDEISEGEMLVDGFQVKLIDPWTYIIIPNGVNLKCTIRR